MLSDAEWLATRTGLDLLGGPFHVPGEAAALAVEPTHVAAAARTGARVVAAVGWPTGRHHSLVKAAEARLAAETGAHEIWLAPDPDGDASALLADIVAVRQSVEVPLGVLWAGEASAEAARLAGADALIVPADAVLPATELAVVVRGAAPGTASVVEHLERGASRVFTAPPARAAAAR